MNKRLKLLAIFAVIFLFANGPYYVAVADHGYGKEKSWHEKLFDRDDDDDDEKHHRKRYLAPVSNAAYKEECGACHFVYQPELLPSASWERILDSLEDHFGDAVELDPDASKTILDYLSANAAEHSSAKRAVKIMRSLRATVPLRITEIPYIRRKHHEVTPDVLKRESIGSLSNCSACHTTAEDGIYEDDYVVIPK